MLLTQLPRVQIMALLRFFLLNISLFVDSFERLNPLSNKQGSANPVGAYTELVLKEKKSCDEEPAADGLQGFLIISTGPELNFRKLSSLPQPEKTPRSTSFHLT